VGHVALIGKRDGESGGS